MIMCSTGSTALFYNLLCVEDRVLIYTFILNLFVQYYHSSFKHRFYCTGFALNLVMISRNEFRKVKCLFIDQRKAMIYVFSNDRHRKKTIGNHHMLGNVAIS